MAASTAPPRSKPISDARLQELLDECESPLAVADAWKDTACALRELQQRRAAEPTAERCAGSIVIGSVARPCILPQGHIGMCDFK